METAPVVLLLGFFSEDVAHAALGAELEKLGVASSGCLDLADLRQQLNRMPPAVANHCIAVINGVGLHGPATTSAMRMLYPGIGILVLTTAGDTQGQLQHLQHGADLACTVDTPVALMAGMVLRLYWRMNRTGALASVSPPSGAPQTQAGTPANAAAVERSCELATLDAVAAAPADTATVTQPHQDGWELHHQGWILATPSGRQVSLTTAERALMQALFAAPGRQAPHNVLLKAVNQYTAEGGERRSLTNLGVLVSRMRRRFHRMDIPLPLQSIHKWGYMFAGQNVSDPATDTD